MADKLRSTQAAGRVAAEWTVALAALAKAGAFADLTADDVAFAQAQAVAFVTRPDDDPPEAGD